MRQSTWILILWMLIAAAVRPPARAQVARIPEFSARTARADLPRSSSAGDSVALGLLDPIWRPGIFVMSANPAGLPWEIASPQQDFMLRHDAEHGAYRRPLDPAASKQATVEATGWQRVGAQAAMIGRINFDQQRMAPGPLAVQADPYSSNPFVTADTSSSAVTVTRVAMDGSAGWALGNTAFGLTLGYETRDAHSVASGFVRRDRAVLPGVIAGVARRLASDTACGGVTLGLAAGWRGGAETIDLDDRAQAGRVYEIAGLAEPEGFSVTRDPYYHRFEQTSEFVNGSAAVRVARIDIALGLQAARAEDRNWVIESDHPPANRWSPRTLQADFGADYRPSYGLVQLRAQWKSLRGAAHLSSDSSIGAVFDTRQHEAFAYASFRTPLDATWVGALAVSIDDARHVRRDTVSGILADVQSRTPALRVAFGRWFASSLLVEAGLQMSRVTVRGRIPSARARSDAYRTYIAPALELYATPASQSAAHLTLNWCFAGETRLWLRGSSSTASPDAGRFLTDFPPRGDRRAASVGIGVTILPFGHTGPATAARACRSEASA